MKILFICTGNTCRSPMAEVIFKNMCIKNGREDIIVGGAGTNAHAGEDMTAEAREALRICGEHVDDNPNPSTHFDKSMIDVYDYIITMTRAHTDIIEKSKNVFSLDELTRCGDILDPYMYPLDIYISVCRTLQKALAILYTKIVPTGAIQN